MSAVSENSSLSVDYDFDCGLFDDDFLAGDDAMLLDDFEIREPGSNDNFVCNEFKSSVSDLDFFYCRSEHEEK